MMDLTLLMRAQPKRLLGLLFCAAALLLCACQQTQIVFTPTKPPSLASFETPYSLSDALPQSGAIIPATDNTFTAEVHPQLNLPYRLHRATATQAHNSISNRVSLAAVSTLVPFNNPDILQIAFQEKARALAITTADPCLETFTILVSLHSINLSLTCPDNVNHIFDLLLQFWQPDTFSQATAAPVDIDNIRRQLKLNKHLNAFSGAEIDKVWRDKLLGPEHPYNRVLNNAELFDSLNLNQLQQIQQQAATQAQWHLFLPNMQANNAEFDPQASIQRWPTFTKLMPQTDTSVTSNPKQTKKIYLIDAPGNVQTQVRLGYALDDALGPSLNEIQVDAAEPRQLSPQEVTLSCRSLAALLGRSFSGRLYYDLREKRGLTYGIYGQCADAPLSSSIKFYGSTAIEHTGAFVVGILDHLALVKAQSASQGEIDALKTYLIGEDLLIQDNPIQSETQYIHRVATGLDPVQAKSLSDQLQSLAPETLRLLAGQSFSGAPLIILRGDVDKISSDLKTKLPDWQLEVVKAN